MKRRDFLGFAAAVPALGAVSVRKIGKLETPFKSPGPRPNDLQATPAGMWVLDAENNKAYLVTWEDGKILREFDTESNVGSGITESPDGLWIAVTPNRTILRADAMTGKTLEANYTPGAGVMYRMPDDPPARRSPLEPPAPAQAPRGNRNSGQNPGAARAGSVDRTLGTGANGLEWRDGKIWMAVPPARQIFCVDTKTWMVEKKFDTAGNRTHGLGWEGNFLWNSDPNLNGFFKHDISTGRIVECIQLGEKDPLPHGMTVWQGYLWYCDEVGVICRFQLG